MSLPNSRLLKSPWLWATIAAISLGLAGVWLLYLSRAKVLTRLEPAAPFQVGIGRGSGLYGLDTINVQEDGTVLLHRNKYEFGGRVSLRFVETASLKLNPQGVAEIRRMVEESRVLKLGKAYHAGVADGTQWVLWVKQGGKEKTAYFDNLFPDEVVRFADALDQVLDENGLGQAEWTRLVPSDGPAHDRALWECLDR